MQKTTSPLSSFSHLILQKRKRAFFCDLRRCCNFTEESFIANHPRAWSPIQIKKKKAFFWFAEPCTYLFSYHQTCLRILQGYEGIYFLIILSQQAQECLYGVQRRMPIWSTEEKVQNQYYRRRRDKKSVNCCKSHTFIILSHQISKSL